MSKIPPALESHLAGEVTTHCFCWIVRRQDGVIHGFTDHDRDLIVAGVSCGPQTGFSASEATSSLGLAVDSAEIEGALSSVSITDADIEGGAFDGAVVETFLVNWASPDQIALLRSARIGTITRSGRKFVAETKSSSADLDKVKGRRITRQCDAQLGDHRCGYVAGSQTGTVAAILSDREMIATGLQPPSGGWFDNGVLTWISGVDVRRSNVVLNQVAAENGTRLCLRDASIPDMKIGEVFSLKPGCDKSFAQCKAKFSNSANFRGFPHLPGNDAAYNYADGQGIFDGKPLVP
ncbi:DUF2163 domain-containing protein [Phyllobacterium endophyticum]|uniref:Bacteriophage phiJL001 Gp84 C-terminal domain-containing protein n=1 Tax=Phyllobacterium endophyticum TaxID=1149773 RepID=A0A2P7B234_9HYPH|nr:DUF2163 domain-containing protein [Phyllobacterium endophyticum]MBB3238132.1 putative phage protein (TIGR02218 family) [Phyllobacterium endophyticum]PSH60536.1 hypothetical protein CU100_07675 [Phyllobacterium endophyticum]TYR42711.1 DUF2163 domain-containing protein [Phyllobacterium endophyticum]